jgi:hypothetical protein
MILPEVLARALIKSQKFSGQTISNSDGQRGTTPPLQQTPITLDEPDALDAKSFPARLCAESSGVRFVECVGLIGGFFLRPIR